VAGSVEEQRKLYAKSSKGPFKVIVPLGGSHYVEGEKLRRLILQILGIYGYLSGSSLGSKGALKMMHGKYGDVIPTNKLYLVLNEVSKENPLVEILWETARGLWRVYGDGIKTTLLLAFKLYERAYNLIKEYELHPSIIGDGYTLAMRLHLRTLEELAEKAPRLTCRQAASSLLWGSQARDMLSSMLCKALDRFLRVGCKLRFSEAIDFERVEGGSLQDSFLYEGVVIRKRLSRSSMPRYVRGPLRILVLDQKLYIDLRYEGYNMVTDNVDLALELKDKLSRTLNWITEKLKKLNINMLVNVKGIDQALEESLERSGILVLRRIPPEKARLLATSSGAKLISSIQDASPKDVGILDLVEERAFYDRYYTFLMTSKGCASTAILRGPWYSIDTVFEEARMASRGLEVYLADPRGLPAGGAPEVEASLKIREYARRVRGKLQLAMEAYADAIEVIPRTLARHAALHPEEALSTLKALHNSGFWASGIDEEKRRIEEDLASKGILDLYAVRRAAVIAGVSLALSLLRIDGASIHRRGAYLREIREPNR
jgi:chaperonin GroEL (HSP60 family)